MQQFNPWEPGFIDDPYPTYQYFRENDPVHWNGEPFPSTSGAWCLFRHADINAVLKDPRFVREYGNVFPDTKPPVPVEPDEQLDPAPPPQSSVSFWHMAGQWMLFRDPPDHTRLRGLVNKAFTPRVVEGYANRVEAIALELLAPALKDGGMDLIEAFAFPLPVIVIAEMLGVPASDRQKFKSWSNSMAAAMDVFISEEVINKANQATAEISEYLADIIEKRRRDPGDDLLSALISAREKDDRLSEQELVAMAILLLVAGHETTVNLIGNGSLALLKHPDQLALLKSDLSLAPQAVEELLRYDAPVQATTRRAAGDVTIGGKTIRHGDEVIVYLGAANRDPAVYDDPDDLDIRRQGIRHLSFGGGIHYCVGAPLARREGQIALTTLLANVPSMRLLQDEPKYRPGLVFRGLKALPVSFQ